MMSSNLRCPCMDEVTNSVNNLEKLQAETYSHLKHKLTDNPSSELNGLKDILLKTIDSTSELIKQNAPKVIGLIDETAKNLSNTEILKKEVVSVKKNPIAALLAAFGLGFFITMWMKRK